MFSRWKIIRCHFLVPRFNTNIIKVIVTARESLLHVEVAFTVAILADPLSI